MQRVLLPTIDISSITKELRCLQDPCSRSMNESSPKELSLARTVTAVTAMRAKKSDSAPTILLDMAVLAQLISTPSPKLSVGIAKCASMYLHACADSA